MRDKTIIRIERRPKEYAVMATHHLNDSRLSWRAKGILSYLLSKPDHWELVWTDLLKKSTDKIKAARAAINESRKLGYIELKCDRDTRGQIEKWVYIVLEKPKRCNLLKTHPDTLLGDVARATCSESATSNNEKDSNNKLNTTTADNIDQKVVSSNYLPIIGNPTEALLEAEEIVAYQIAHGMTVKSSRRRLVDNISEKLIQGKAERPEGYATRAERHGMEKLALEKREKDANDRADAERKKEIYLRFVSLPLERKNFYTHLAKAELGKVADLLPEFVLIMKAAELAMANQELQ